MLDFRFRSIACAVGMLEGKVLLLGAACSNILVHTGNVVFVVPSISQLVPCQTLIICQYPLQTHYGYKMLSNIAP